MALAGKAEDALGILRTKHSEKKIGQLLILTLCRRDEEFDIVLENIDVNDFESDREKYTYHSFAARRAYIKATPEEFLYGKVLPIQGKANFDIHTLKKALHHAEKAWDFARKVGYPGDISILLDISSLIFGYFNKLDTLIYHFDEILFQRPNNVDLIRHYARLSFNKGTYEKTIELLKSVEFNRDGDDCGLLMLSHYHLGKTRLALDVLKKNEKLLLKDQPQNLAFIFCIGSEIAENLMEEELSGRYIKIVEGFDNGKVVLAISAFIKGVNNDPDNKNTHGEKLFSEYIRLDRPIEVAEQLLRFFNPNLKEEAKIICDLAERILSSHELFEKDYFRLAQAHITNNNYESALFITEKHIEKGVYDPYWSVIQTLCYQRLGRVGLAHDVIKRAVQENPFSIDHRHYYANICLQLGLSDDLENALFDLLGVSTERVHKLSILTNLISILSSKADYSEKTTSAIRQFGRLVNPNNMREEGQFLIFFLTSAKTENDNEISEFQTRLKNYSSNFPESPILKQGHIDIEGGADSLIASIHKMTGITDEQIAKWEENKLMVRNGSLPVPFVMLEKFLSDSSDIFTSWMLSLNSGDEHLEYKIKHAPQLDMQTFESELTTDKTVIIEDTTLLILHELQLLELFLDNVSEFCLLDSTFERVAKNIHPIAGTIYNGLAKGVLDSVNKFKSKMVLFAVEGNSPVDTYIEAIKNHDALFVIDDLNLLQMVNISNKEQVVSANIFNLIEMMYNHKHLNKEDKFSLVSRASAVGFQIPNMTLSLLAETLAFHSMTLNEVDYLNTEFNVIFKKIFNTQRDTVEVVDLFFRMIGLSINQFDMALQPKPIAALLRSLLLRHSYKDLKSFVAFFFVYLALMTPVKIDSKLILTSQKHVNLWQLYQDILLNVTDGKSSIDELVVRIVYELFTLQERSRMLAYNNIKHCFVPMTRESITFEKEYQRAAVQYQLFNLRGEKLMREND